MLKYPVSQCRSWDWMARCCYQTLRMAFLIEPTRGSKTRCEHGFTRECVDVELALKSCEVACRVILRGRVGVENGELKVGVHRAHLNEESTDAAHRQAIAS
jgi:hypothetical protein